MASSVHPELGLVISGGYIGQDQVLRTVESTTDGKTFMELPDMPEALHAHCQVTIDQ